MLVTRQSKTVPYITQRASEVGDLLADLRGAPGPRGRMRLAYRGERPEDRDVRGVLWGRCGQAPRDEHGVPMGEPVWRMAHPARQRQAMQYGLCHVCARPARTAEGLLFLAGRDEYGPAGAGIITCQPPVCPPHAPVAAELWPYLAGEPAVFLAASCPLYGVLGTPYVYDAGELQALAPPQGPVAYRDPGLNLGWLLASQLARQLRAVQRIGLSDVRDLRPAPRSDSSAPPGWS
ncbi:hypothetical protein AB0I46_28785 [Streptomyces spectabilis]|uniref:hypothetical protein n=2 Tax=Streptomyces spectabilis TaxID=68270 RepID=UPI0033E8A13F